MNGKISSGKRLRPFSLLLLVFSAVGVFAFGCGGDGSGNPSDGDTPSWTGDPVVKTRYGAVCGYEDKSETWSWKAIPFAAPPVGELRWKAPRDPEPWEGVRENNVFCSPCTQYAPVGDLILGSEDCLYLNVWRPRTAERKLPVYFWIHGGGNSIGSAGSNDYNGANLAHRSNVVVVTTQYRLGPLGWFTHPAIRDQGVGVSEDDSGNYGTLDILHALKWVRDNIEAFGGDPREVMIAGESAGAINVFSLLISPRAEGLFHRALAESGIPRASTIEEGEQAARELIKGLLVRDGLAADLDQAAAVLDGMQPEEIETYLRSKSSRDLLAPYKPSLGGMLEFSKFPNVFLDGLVIPEGGYDALDEGSYPNKVPVMVGSNKEELKLFLFLDPTFQGRDDLYQVVASYGSDGWKAAGVDDMARRLRANSDQPAVYAYQFLWGAGGDTGQSQIPDPWGFRLGCFHALEIPFFFGNDSVLEVFQLLVFNKQNQPGREVLTSAMMAYAAEFLRTGNPNPPGSGLPEWLPWSNDPGGPKCILFDVTPDQSLDVAMSNGELTLEGVQKSMAAEVPEPLYSEAAEYLESFLSRLFSE